MASFSFESGKPIAKIYGGHNNGKLLRILGDEDKDPEDYEETVLDVLDENCPDLSDLSLDILYNAIISQRPPKARDLHRHYVQCMEVLQGEEMTSFELDDDEYAQPLPTCNDQMNDRIYIAGPSGCGKSTWAGLFCIDYQNANPSNKIYLFSRKNKDSALDQVDGIERIDMELPANNIEETIAKRDRVKNRGPISVAAIPHSPFLSTKEEPDTGVKIEEIVDVPDREPDEPKIEEVRCSLVDIINKDKLELFKNSLVIFDDTDSLPEETKKIVCEIRDDLLETGRESKISIIVTSHILANYYNTRTIINEATGFVFFPAKGAKDQIKAFLKNRLNLSKEQIPEAMNLTKRWIYIYKDWPRYIIYEHGGLII